MFFNDWRQAARSLILVPALLCLAMEGKAQERISQATAVRVPELEAEFDKVYTREGPLGTVSRRLYIRYPRPNVSSVMTADYMGREGLRRFEVLTYQVFDDVYQDAERRYSEDNGKTWTAWERDPEVDIVCAGDYSHQRFLPTGPSRGCYDPESGLTVQPYSLATFAGDPRKTGLRGTNYLAEIDETGPALKRATLTVIDDYDPARHTPAVQFSNFYVFENRETQEFEIYLSPYGQYGNVYQANVYKYVIALR